MLGSLAQLHYALPRRRGRRPASDVKGAAVRREFQQLTEVFQRDRGAVAGEPAEFVWTGYSRRALLQRRPQPRLDDPGDVQEGDRNLEQAPAMRRDFWAGRSRSTPRAVDGLLELGDHLRSAPPLDERWLDRGAGVRGAGGRTRCAGRLRGTPECRSDASQRDYENYDGLAEDCPSGSASSVASAWPTRRVAPRVG